MPEAIPRPRPISARELRRIVHQAIVEMLAPTPRQETHL